MPIIDDVYAYIRRLKKETERPNIFGVSTTGEHIVVTGNRWLKVVHEQKRGPRRAIAFIDSYTGDIYYPKSWTARGRKVGNVKEEIDG